MFIAALVLPVCCVARAAELDGVIMPDQVQVGSTVLQLNGIGLRTYSLLGIRIYVAALYLRHRSADPEAILQSPETKLLTIKFVRNVSAEEGRRAWRNGLEDNCQAPCRLDPTEVARFLAAIPPMHVGETFSFLFTRRGVTVTGDGQTVGDIPHPRFAEAMLATFLGRNPASQRLKRQLLGDHR